jgi:hypothetical protein
MAHFQVNDGLNHPYPLNKPGMVGDKYSPLIQKIESRHGDVALSDDEILKIRYWINTGALYPGTYAALGTGIIGRMLNNNADQSPVENEVWVKASKVINKDCRGCHQELMSNIIEEKNLTWWRSRVDVSSGNIDQEKYSEAIRFSRHIIYDLDKPEKSTILLAPLSKQAGGYELCIRKDESPVFSSLSDKKYLTILSAIESTSGYFRSIKRFDDRQFVVSPDYYREMKRFGVIDENVAIDKVNPYEVDSIYWGMKKNQ